MARITTVWTRLRTLARTPATVSREDSTARPPDSWETMALVTRCASALAWSAGRLYVAEGASGRVRMVTLP